MNAIAHPHPAASQAEVVERVRRSVRSALPAVFAVVLFVAVFAVALAVRFLRLAQTNPEVAATLHRIAQALGLAS
ncbi:MAG TPA: hypothetical protein VLY46_09750 [Usitatibacter sp.]|nr:hypothetical protein [Usitatibacter sp.]